jgi:long-chain acyl-CoA synthetase
MARLTAPIVERKGGDAALVDDHGETSWSEFDQRVNRVINGLRSAGVGPGGTVALIAVTAASSLR